MAVKSIKKYKIIFLIYLVSALIPSVSQASSELKEVSDRIARQRQEIKSLSTNSSNVSKEIDTLQRLQANERRAIVLLNKGIVTNNSKINEYTTEEIALTKKNIYLQEQMNDNIKFLLENQGTYTARAIFAEPNKEDASTVSELMGKVSDNLLKQMEEYNSALEDLDKLKVKLNSENFTLKRNLTDKENLVTEHDKSSKQLLSKLSTIKNDEKAKKEYLNILLKEQERITERIRSNDLKSSSTAKGIFAKQKGKLPRPIMGVVIESFGEKLIAEAGIKIMHKGLKYRPTGNGKVTSISDGTVIYVDNINGMENIIILQHDYEYYSVYANLDEFYVSVNSAVKKGEEIGMIDISLKGDLSYLYFEIRQHEIAINPVHWLTK